MDPNSHQDPAPEAGAPPQPPGDRRRRIIRLAVLTALIVGAAIWAKASGFTEQITVESLRETMQAAGWWGALLFIVVFCVGELLQVPGLLFVAAGVAAYGRVEGGILSFVAGVLSVCVSFWIVRAAGGQLLTEVKRPLMQRVLAHLDRRPVLTVAVLRTLFLMSPPLNYALALSSITFGRYFLGSALGLLVPIALAVLLFEQLLAWVS